MTNQTLPDSFPIPLYDPEEIIEMGYTLADAVPKVIKGCTYYILKKDRDAELEWSKKKFGAKNE